MITNPESPPTQSFLLDQLPFIVTIFRDILFVLVIVICVLQALVSYRYVRTIWDHDEGIKYFLSTIKLLLILTSAASIATAGSILLTNAIFNLGETLYVDQAQKYIASSKFNATLLQNFELTTIIIVSLAANAVFVFRHLSTLGSYDKRSVMFDIMRMRFAKTLALTTIVPTLCLIALRLIDSLTN